MSLHTISAGGYTAEVREYGGALVSMEYNGRTIVERDLEGGKPAFFGGDILAPWPNRLRDGEYIFNGKRYQAFVNEEKWSTALHGLVFDEIIKDTTVPISEYGVAAVGYKNRLRHRFTMSP